MKLLLPLIFILLSCGKKTEQKPFYEVDPTTLEADSDGDGMLDWDEKYVGRDPFLADIDESLPRPSDEITLIDENSTESTVPALMSRTLRDSLMQEIGSLTKVAHPLLNSLAIRLDHAPEFWRLYFSRFTFKKIRLAAQRVETVQEAFMGRHLLAAPTPEKKMLEIKNKTYRLVVSMPHKDLVFHLSPHIKIKDFLQSRFELRFDVNGAVIQVDDLEQNVEHTAGLDQQSSHFIWRAVGMPLNLQARPVAGETYALVYATVQEFRAAAMNNLTYRYPQKINRGLQYGHTTSLIVFIPKSLQMRWKDSHETLPIRIGNGDRERTCEFISRKLIDYQPRVLSSAQELLKTLELNGVQDIKVDWIESGDVGLAAKLTMKAKRGEINASLSIQAIPTGLIKSDCQDLKPLKIENFPLWKEAQGHFSWLPER